MTRFSPRYSFISARGYKYEWSKRSLVRQIFREIRIVAASVKDGINPKHTEVEPTL